VIPNVRHKISANLLARKRHQNGKPTTVILFQHQGTKF